MKEQILIRNPLWDHQIDYELWYKMIDWMIEVTGAFHLDERVFFLSVSIMDLYLQKEP